MRSVNSPDSIFPWSEETLGINPACWSASCLESQEIRVTPMLQREASGRFRVAEPAFKGKSYHKTTQHRKKQKTRQSNPRFRAAGYDTERAVQRAPHDLTRFFML